MKKMVMIVLLCAVAAVFVFANVIILEGWSSWGGVRATARRNTVILNGRFTGAAGFVNEWLNVTELKGRTVILEIQNAEESTFSNNRMLKITMNHYDELIIPSNVEYLIEGEYVPSSYTQIEFNLPETFDGKIGLVFFNATLTNLEITVTYR